MNVYGARNLVCVSIPQYSAKYGFRTNAEPPATSAFGHKPISFEPEPVVFGARNPRPPRGRYIGEGPLSQSFVDLEDYDKEAVRLIDRGRGPVGANNRVGTPTRRVWVRWWGAEYVFDQRTAPLIGDLDGEVLWAEYARPRINSFFLANDVVLGGRNRGKPQRARAIRASDGYQMSSFIHSPTTGDLPDGWTIIGGNALE